jgi:integrase
MTLDEAKARAALVSLSVRDGTDPLHARASLSKATLGELVDEYLTEHRKRHRRVSTDEVERIVNVDVLPLLKAYRADHVRKADIMRAVEAVAKRGAFVSADRVLTTIRSIFNWAVATGRLETNPSAGLKKRNGRKPRERVLSDSEIATLWNALNSTPYMALGIRDALRLQLLLGTRIGETVGARRSEFDLKARVWTIPASSAKDWPTTQAVLPSVMMRRSWSVLAGASRTSSGRFAPHCSVHRPVAGFRLGLATPASVST